MSTVWTFVYIFLKIVKYRPQQFTDIIDSISGHSIVIHRFIMSTLIIELNVTRPDRVFDILSRAPGRYPHDSTLSAVFHFSSSISGPPIFLDSSYSNIVHSNPSMPTPNIIIFLLKLLKLSPTVFLAYTNHLEAYDPNIWIFVTTRIAQDLEFFHFDAHLIPNVIKDPCIKRRAKTAWDAIQLYHQRKSIRTREIFLPPPLEWQISKTDWDLDVCLEDLGIRGP